MDAERDALVALYRATNGDRWFRKEGWCTNAPVSEWYGVKVSDGRVVELHLHQNNLDGSIPKEVGQLGALTTLDLKWNQLKGSIPKELGQLGALTKLNLAVNQLEGSIPKELGQLGALTTLDLRLNKLEGSIPKELGQLGALTKLNLLYNKLEGDDPNFYTGTQRKPEVFKGKLQTKNQMTEVDVPDKAQEQRKAEMASSNPWYDKGSSNLGKENEVILAESLGTQAMEFFDSSFGIELILEDNSLEEEIKKQVVIKPRMKFVTCDHERDTSRTHAELLERSSKYEDSEARATSTFLIMPIIHGPSEATFHPDRPAKLRYFVGNLKELQDEILGESGGEASISRDAVEKHLREVYEPLISADGEKWRMLPPFDIIFRKTHNEATNVWLETRLYHFSEGSVGEVFDPSKLENSNCRVHVGKIPRRSWREKRYPDHVLFGNDTKEMLIFYGCKLLDGTSSDRGREAGLGAGPANVTAGGQDGMSFQSSGLDHIMPYKVPAGEYKTMPMPIEGVWVHKQVLYAAFLCKETSEQRPPEQGIFSFLWSFFFQRQTHSPIIKRRQFFLEKDRLNKDRMVIIRESMLDWWGRQEGMETTKKLDYDASLPEVKEFLLNN